jgi:prophage antirepressor-like protein
MCLLWFVLKDLCDALNLSNPAIYAQKPISFFFNVINITIIELMPTAKQKHMAGIYS